MQSRAATALLELFGRAGRVLPDVRGRGRISIAVSSFLMKAGAHPVVEGKMARGHRMRLDCRVPSHCWAFFSGRYDDEKIAVLLSFLRPGGIALDVGANIGFYAVPLAIRAKAIGSQVVAVEPVATNAEWLRYNLALNGCSDVTEVLEVALGNECGQAEMVLAEDFLGGGVVGNAIISSQLYGPEFTRATVQLNTLDRIWPNKPRIDVIKVDIEGQETNFLEGGQKTIAAHRPAFLIETNRWHPGRARIDVETAIPCLLPERYLFAEMRPSGIVQIPNLMECHDADVIAFPEERRPEI
jgi:FkbM family methyltransferase